MREHAILEVLLPLFYIDSAHKMFYIKTVTVIIIGKKEAMLKYSRQRESIKNFLIGRYDHPTAETIYKNMKMEYPNISLGTVYRNLSLLTSLGEIQKVSTGIGPDRFDGNSAPHYHFICKDCGCVMDLKTINLDHINILAAQDFAGEIEGHYAHFYGRCPDCQTRTAKQSQQGDVPVNV